MDDEHPHLDELLADLQAQITNHYAEPTVEDAAEQAVTADKMRLVHESIVRQAAGAIAAAACKAEQTRLIAAQHKHEVESELVRTVAQQEADRAASVEQQRRVSEPAELPSDVAEILAAVRAQLIADMEAFKAAQLAKHQAVARQRMLHVGEEIERAANQRAADAAAENERVRRVSEPAPAPDAARQAALQDLHLQVERRAEQKAALVAMEDERARRVAADKLAVVSEELRRAFSAVAADSAMDVEQERRVSDVPAIGFDVADALVQVHESLIRFRAVREAVTLAQHERVRRIAAAHKQVALDALVSAAHRKEARRLSELARADQLADSTLQTSAPALAHKAELLAALPHKADNFSP